MEQGKLDNPPPATKCCPRKHRREGVGPIGLVIVQLFLLFLSLYFLFLFLSLCFFLFLVLLVYYTTSSGGSNQPPSLRSAFSRLEAEERRQEITRLFAGFASEEERATEPQARLDLDQEIATLFASFESGDERPTLSGKHALESLQRSELPEQNLVADSSMKPVDQLHAHEQLLRSVASKQVDCSTTSASGANRMLLEALGKANQTAERISKQHNSENHPLIAL